MRGANELLTIRRTLNGGDEVMRNLTAGLGYCRVRLALPPRLDARVEVWTT